MIKAMTHQKAIAINPTKFAFGVNNDQAGIIIAAESVPTHPDPPATATIKLRIMIRACKPGTFLMVTHHPTTTKIGPKIAHSV